jgi:hypothetical protein
LNVNDLILNIDEAYIQCDDRLRKSYSQEFEEYSPSKLEKVWEVIQEHHTFAKAPELGNIFKYMNLVGVGRTKESGTYYNRCTELKPELDYGNNHMKDSEGDLMYVQCGTKYSLNSKFCPTCNLKANISKPVMNSRIVVKCDPLPSDLKILNELCATCNVYQKNPYVKGSKCTAWNCHDDFRKANKDCKGCSCVDCCNEKPMNGIQKATMDLLKGSIKRLQY